MSSPIYYIFLEPLDKIWRDHHQHFDSFQDIDWIHDDKYHPRPLVIWVTIDNIFTFLSSQTCSCYGCNLLSSSYYVLPWSIIVLYDKDVARFSTSSKFLIQVILINITILFLVPVLFLTEIPINGLWCVNSNLLATLLLWSYWSIVSFYVYGLLNYHSNIDCAA